MVLHPQPTGLNPMLSPPSSPATSTTSSSATTPNTSPITAYGTSQHTWNLLAGIFNLSEIRADDPTKRMMEIDLAQIIINSRKTYDLSRLPADPNDWTPAAKKEFELCSRAQIIIDQEHAKMDAVFELLSSNPLQSIAITDRDRRSPHTVPAERTHEELIKLASDIVNRAYEQEYREYYHLRNERELYKAVTDKARSVFLDHYDSNTRNVINRTDPASIVVDVDLPPTAMAPYTADVKIVHGICTYYYPIRVTLGNKELHQPFGNTTSPVGKHHPVMFPSPHRTLQLRTQQEMQDIITQAAIDYHMLRTDCDDGEIEHGALQYNDPCQQYLPPSATAFMTKVIITMTDPSQHEYYVPTTHSGTIPTRERSTN